MQSWINVSCYGYLRILNCKNAETAMKEIGEHLCICTKLTAPPPDCIWGTNTTYSPFSSRQNLVNLLKVGA